MIEHQHAAGLYASQGALIYIWQSSQEHQGGGGGFVCWDKCWHECGCRIKKLSCANTAQTTVIERPSCAFTLLLPLYITMFVSYGYMRIYKRIILYMYTLYLYVHVWSRPPPLPPTCFHSFNFFLALFPSLLLSKNVCMHPNFPCFVLLMLQSLWSIGIQHCL